MSFVKLNINPLEKKTGDCVVRAIACATKQSWEKVYRDLTELGLEMYEMPNSKNVYQKYLENMGWKKMPMPKLIIGGDFTNSGHKFNYKRYTLDKFSQHANRKEPYIVQVSKHLTVIENGDIIDTWNCGGYSVGNYFTK